MQVREYPLRFSIVFLFLILLLSFFTVRLILIQIFRSSYLSSLAERQQNHLIELEPLRGGIYDRYLRPLAVNISVYSLYANPKIMSEADKKKALKALPGLINMPPSTLAARLNKDKYFVWLERKLPINKYEEIKKLKIKGLSFMDESKRYYPNAELASHLIGFAGIDNDGLEGLELVHNDILKGKPGQAHILRDARQQDLMFEKNFLPPSDGLDLVLTIDETIQFLAERALDKAYKKHHAKSGTIIVVDVKTGEILALANRPTYNLQEAFKSSVESRTNRALSFVYEPGSVFKIVPAAAALEEEMYTETDKIFCENGQYRVANHILHDHHPHGTLSFKEVFEQSSNIGVTKISQKLGPDMIYKYGRLFRFGMKTGIDLRGEVRGVLKHPSQWSKTSIGAIPIGHEITSTPLQMVYAMAAVANQGVYMKPYLLKCIKDKSDEIIKYIEPQVVDRVISPSTAKRLTEILVGVVENGTGKLAKIEGIKVAGKTGTAQKVINGTYSHSNFYASFVGFAPADNPRLAAIVVFDDPHPSYFGGTVSAPVFSEVVGDALRYLKTTESLASVPKTIQNEAAQEENFFYNLLNPKK